MTDTSFHSYASRIGSKLGVDRPLGIASGVSIHTLHELEARGRGKIGKKLRKCFHSYASRIGSKKNHKSGRSWRVFWCFHSYASRIGSKCPGSPDPGVRWPVSIHTLHELEARQSERTSQLQAARAVSIHTLHELEARSFKALGRILIEFCFHSYASRIGSKLKLKNFRIPTSPYWKFPFIRFTNWKQASVQKFLRSLQNIWFPFIRFTNWKQGFRLFSH